MITYRPPSPMDVAVLVALDKELFPYSPWSSEQYKEELAAIPATRFYSIAENEKGEIVGYAGVFCPGEDIEADILTVGVIPLYRRQGIARELIRQMEFWCGERSASAIMLEVKIDNLEAITLYESLGYMKIAVRTDYFGPGLDAQVMRKVL